MQTFGQSSIYCGSDDTAPTKPRTGLFLEPAVFSSLFPVSALGFSLLVRHGGDCRRSLVGLQQKVGAMSALGHKRTFHTLIRHVRFGRNQTWRRDGAKRPLSARSRPVPGSP
jgi:hypothetical protein